MSDSPCFHVAVALPLRDVYTYSAPEPLQALCVPGMRVLVPLGNRRVTGYILEGASDTGEYKVRHILDVLDDTPLFAPWQVPFFKWVADYYIHPLGEVIKAALPSGLNRYDVKRVQITDEGRAAVDAGTLDGTARDLLEAALKKGMVSLNQVKKSIKHPSLNTLIRRLEKQGLLEVASVLKADTVHIRQEAFLSPGKRKNPEPLRMSIKRKKILEIVRSHGELSLSGLKTHVPTAATLIKPLTEAGYLDVEMRQVFRDPLGETVEPDQPPELSREQETVVEAVSQKLSGFGAYLLNGVTGSGKTEVYLRLVRSVIDEGRQAVVLVPEISLISQTERRFRARFGSRIAVIHSALSAGEKLDQWQKIRLGRVDVVIGARSCIFAPFERIGLVIVDEEHDLSYKQESGLRYNARDLAVVLARFNRCPVVLGSATPSVQSHYNVVTNKFQSVCLTRRINRRPMPEIEIIDLKQYKDARGMDRVITPELVKRIRSCLDQGEQALVFLNRRGFASSPLCKDCGEQLTCRYCDVTLTLHKHFNAYRCHLCGFSLDADRGGCTKCGSRNIRPLGFGTERIESMMTALFPDARVVRMDQDTTKAKGAMLKILRSIRNRNVDIIVGTQMLAKGHDFPHLTVVGIVCADLSLNLPDFRAGERTFQLLAQVAGRAGRGDVPGRVVMQTYNPDHFIIEASRMQDFQAFYNNEAPFRKALMYPPFARMIQLRVAGGERGAVEGFAGRFAGGLHDYVSARKDLSFPVQILGPIEAPISRISSRFRWQILLKSPSAGFLNEMVSTVRDQPENKPPAGVRLVVDVDPYFLM